MNVNPNGSSAPPPGPSPDAAGPKDVPGVEGPTPAGLLADGNGEHTKVPQASVRRQYLDANTDGLAQLRTPEGQIPPGAQMIALQVLTSQFTTIMTELFSENIDKLSVAKNLQASEFIKQIEDVGRKLRAALGSWLNKLPGWLVKTAVVVATICAVGMAAAATAASGGVAAAPAMAALTIALAVIATYSFVQTVGTIVWERQGRTDPFGFAALAKNGLLPESVGRAIDCFLSGDIAGGITNLADAWGTDDPKTLMILNAVLTAVTVVLMLTTMLCLAPSKAVAASELYKNSQLVSNFMQVVQGIATSAQAGVTSGEIENDVAAIRSQANADLVRLTLEVLTDSLTNAIEMSTKFFDAYQNVTDSVVAVLKSEHRTADEIIAQTA